MVSGKVVLYRSDELGQINDSRTGGSGKTTGAKAPIILGRMDAALKRRSSTVMDKDGNRLRAASDEALVLLHAED